MAAGTDQKMVSACRRQEWLLKKDDRRYTRNDGRARDRFFIARLHRGAGPEGAAPYYSSTFAGLKSIVRTLDNGDLSAWWEVKWYMTDFPLSELICCLKLDHTGNITDAYTTARCARLDFSDRHALLAKETRRQRGDNG